MTDSCCHCTADGLRKTGQTVAPAVSAAVDTARIEAADKEPGTWMTTGRTYSEQRYSPRQDQRRQRRQARLAWSYKLVSIAPPRRPRWSSMA